MIELARQYYDDCTLGFLALEDGSQFRTMERPWLNNKPRVSCIPEGVYKLALRDSNIVNRTTSGLHLQGWEVTGVPQRSLIMLHVANWASDLEGCIGVGLAHGNLAGKPAVLQSRVAFERFMLSLAGRKEWYLEIKRK